MLSLQCLSYQRHFLIPPPDIVIIGPAITISYSVFVVTGATSVVFATTLIIITYITAALIFQKNPNIVLSSDFALSFKSLHCSDFKATANFRF